MSQSLQPRRSARAPEPRRLLAEEQAWRRAQELEQREIARAIREAEVTVEASDSEEKELDVGERSEEEEDETAHPADENTPPWSQRLRDVHYPVCTATPIVQLPRHVVRTELGFLQCFIDTALIDTFVTRTNEYATSRQARGWVPATAEEMWRYLAVRIRQGIVDLPDLHHYWQPGYRDSYCTQMMTRDRFLALHRHFHISPPVDRAVKQTVVEKTADFYNQCQALFKQYYVPGQNLAIDETMVRFEGRSDWITVIRNKPTPVGFKIWTVASDGYVLNFRIYRGKGGIERSQTVLHHVVLDLVQHWQGLHRRLYFDNLFTSPALCDALLQIGIRSCGTCRRNRKDLPATVREGGPQLQKGEVRVWQRGQLCCMVWHDKQPVLMLTTHRRADAVTHIPANSGRPAITRPTVAVDYNYNKSHVDRIDQLRSYYIVQRRTVRTWPALAWWLLDTCISNAYKLWCLEGGAKHGQLHFREQLLAQIAAAYPFQRTHVQQHVPAVSRARAHGHWPKHTTERGTCVHCTHGRAGRRTSRYVCELCGVHLCIDDCFKQYHIGHEQGN